MRIKSIKEINSFTLYNIVFLITVSGVILAWYATTIYSLTKSCETPLKNLSLSNRVRILPDYPVDLGYTTNYTDSAYSFIVDSSEDAQLKKVCAQTNLVYIFESDKVQFYDEELQKKGDVYSFQPRKRVPLENSLTLNIAAQDDNDRVYIRTVFFATVDTPIGFFIVTLSYVLSLYILCWIPFKIFYTSLIKRSNAKTVFETKNKTPIFGAVIRVFNEKNRLIKTSVSDGYGNFNIDLEKGVYWINVTHKDYTFPSRLFFPAKNYNNYKDCYYGGPLIVEESSKLMINIPVDNSDSLKKNNLLQKIRYNYCGQHIFQLVLIFLIFFVSIAVSFGLSHDNLILVITMIASIFLSGLFLIQNKLVFGTVRDEDKKYITDIELSIYDRTFDYFLLNVQPDNRGRIFLVLPAGEYYIKIKGDKYKFAHNEEKMNFDIKRRDRNFFSSNIIVKERRRKP